jgi:hypothetical protein
MEWRRQRDHVERAAERRAAVRSTPDRRSTERVKPVKEEIIGFAKPRVGPPNLRGLSKEEEARRMLEDPEWAKFTKRRGGAVRYASGGGVSASEAKRIAERVVGTHVRYPAPEGHRGLEKIYPGRR